MDMVDMDMAGPGRSTSVTSSSYRRRRDSISRSRSRSRSPKRQRYDRESATHHRHRSRDRDRDRERNYRDGSYDHDDSRDRRGRDRDNRGNYDDHRKSATARDSKKREEHSRRHHRHDSSRDHDHDHGHHHHSHSHSHSHSHRRYHDNEKDDKHRSPRQKQKKHHAEPEPLPESLPFGSRLLNRKTDQAAFEPLFAYYLDLHKSLDISTLPADEVRGRWKSFVNKWNRRELAEGWYDPELFQRITGEWRDAGGGGGGGGLDEEATGGAGEVSGGTEMGDVDEFGRVRREEGHEKNKSISSERDEDNYGRQKSPVPAGNRDQTPEPGLEFDSEDNGEDDDDDDDYGPALPPTQRGAATNRHGAEAPTLQDLTLRAESEVEAREEAIEALRQARKEDRRIQKERLDELIPKADAGTRERKLEKKKLVNEKMKGFREKSPGAAVEVPDEDLMGGGEGGADSLEAQKRRLAIHQAKVSERQLRREAIERARAAEREERIREFREKEERAVERLRELARRRFGGGGNTGVAGGGTNSGMGTGTGTS